MGISASRAAMRAALLLSAALLGALGLALGLGGCLDAETLGDAPPTEVTVGSPPQWSNGVETLMQLKCGVCHQVPRAPISPQGIPQSFDLNYQITSPSGVPGATAAQVLSDIVGGILQNPVGGAGPMPPQHATPLLTAERTALEAWAAAGGP